MRIHPAKGRGAWLALGAFFIALTLLFPVHARAVRLKDITSIKGVRSNHLLGYGLVVGLNASGDGNDPSFTAQSLASLLKKLGINTPASNFKVKNVAAVAVSATLPPFARVGSRIDVTLSAIGDAKSLLGGTLLLTPLRGPDGEVYAVTQGSSSYNASIKQQGSETRHDISAYRLARPDQRL